jgi:hypothetical protein
MSCEIIQFSTAARTTRAVSDKQTPAEVTATGDRVLTPGQRRREGRPELPPPATETAKNSRIRRARGDAWEAARRISEYWLARMKWQIALEIAQQYGIADSNSFPSAENDRHFCLADKWREAVAKQMLTPAPDLGAVTWKRAKLKSDDFPYLPIKKEQVERAIADDVAFLEAHPTRLRGSNSEAMARRREFNEAMRQRIRDVAVSRNLSAEDIEPALSLKHHKLATFVEEHGINWSWMLEGAGRMFTGDPIRLGSNSSAEEFAAVVATLPLPDQQAIRILARDMARGRDQ